MITSYKERFSFKTVLPFLVFLLVNNLFAQDGLKIGDPAPELNPYVWIKGEPITGFKKGTLYVVEMGATWCGPCKAAIPKLTELQKKYEGKVEVIGLFVQEINNEPPGTPNPKYLDKVRLYVEKQGDNMDYRVAADGPNKKIEKQWINALGKGRGIPQTFVIDKSGRLAAHFKGMSEEALQQVIESILADTYVPEIEKNEHTIKISRFDFTKQLFVDGNGGLGDEFLFRSILAKASAKDRNFNTGVLHAWGTYYRSESAMEMYRDVLSSVQATNTALEKLYFIAYHDTLENWPESRHQGFGRVYVDYEEFPYWRRAHPEWWHESVLEVSNDSILHTRWNYSLKVPDARRSASQLQKCMREDLYRYFGYEVSVETREMPCLFLKKRPDYDKHFSRTKTPGATRDFRKILIDDKIRIFRNNRDIRDIVKNLYVIHSRRLGYRLPIVDKTGINYEIDHFHDIFETDFSDFSWKEILELVYQAGFIVEEGTKPTKVVVIKDPKSAKPF